MSWNLILQKTFFYFHGSVYNTKLKMLPSFIKSEIDFEILFVLENKLREAKIMLFGYSVFGEYA
jgi:hypothetical protein